jgi:hypothetical protein
MSTVLAGFELHFPFHHPDSFDFLETVSETFKVDTHVCVGDLHDVHANSRHDHDPSGMSAGHELEASIAASEELFTLFPSGKYCLGNHCVRIQKAAFRAGIPGRALKSLQEMYDIPDEWEVGEYFVIDGVVYEHGDRFGSGATIHTKAAISNMKSTVVGHAHCTFGVEFFANRDKLIFGACAGALINPDSYAAAYGKLYAKKSILGAMVIRDGEICIPVPMLLDEKGRWIRRI